MTAVSFGPTPSSRTVFPTSKLAPACPTHSPIDRLLLRCQCPSLREGTGFSYIKPMEVESTFSVTCKLCNEIPAPPEEKIVEAGFCKNQQSGSFL
mmetsp:Transcript_18444/g.43092  ORF Transcript_18444/g.43092 Transcript_18444/m.43092 type:complete len:95 (-) Transcript_18444:1118-1402(-)